MTFNYELAGLTTKEFATLYVQAMDGIKIDRERIETFRRANEKAGVDSNFDEHIGRCQRRIKVTLAAIAKLERPAAMSSPAS